MKKDLNFAVSFYIWLTLVLAGISLDANSQGFQKAFGKAPNKFSNAQHVGTKDGGVLILSDQGSEGGNEYILKLDSNGQKEWSHYLQLVELNDVALIPDSGFVFIGTVGSAIVGNKHIFLCKMDQNGNWDWKKQYAQITKHEGLFVNYADSLDDRIYQREGLYVVGKTDSGGSTRQRAFLFKTDLQGNPVGDFDLFYIGADITNGGKVTGLLTTKYANYLYGYTGGKDAFIITHSRVAARGVGAVKFSANVPLELQGMVKHEDQLYMSGNTPSNGRNNPFLAEIAIDRGLKEPDTPLGLSIYSRSGSFNNSSLTLSPQKNLVLGGNGLLSVDTNQNFLWGKQYNDSSRDSTLFNSIGFSNSQLYATGNQTDTNRSAKDIFMVKANDKGYAGCRANTLNFNQQDLSIRMGLGTIYGRPPEFRSITDYKLDFDTLSLNTFNLCQKQPPQAGFNLTDSIICSGNCIQTIDTSQAAEEWQWYVKTDSSDQQNPEICFNDTGHFMFTQVVSNSFGSDTAKKAITVHPQPNVNAGNDTVICRSSQAQLQASGGTEYEWIPELFPRREPQPDPIVEPDSTMTYKVKAIDNNGCSGQDSVTVQVLQKPEPVKTFDTTICDFDSVTLEAGNPGFQHQWNTGSIAQEITVEKAGNYTVKVSNSCFEEQATFQVNTRECKTRYFIPNAFSPNNDGHNDQFSLKGQFIEKATLTIYNRWGQRLYEETAKRPSWNGRHEGDQVPVGIYLYQFEIHGAFRGRFFEHGLLRVIQ